MMHEQPHALCASDTSCSLYFAKFNLKLDFNYLNQGKHIAEVEVTYFALTLCMIIAHECCSLND